LRAHALLGRHVNCDIRIDVPKVSAEHACLHWMDDAWELRDLGSRNGTFVEGRRLKPGDRVVIEMGTSFSLSRHAAEFKLVDASGPGCSVVMPSRNGSTIRSPIGRAARRGTSLPHPGGGSGPGRLAEGRR
jgi:pSer/pThr/pTyr-binding forkhead associated (FHA) protein